MRLRLHIYFCVYLIYMHNYPPPSFFQIVREGRMITLPLGVPLWRVMKARRLILQPTSHENDNNGNNNDNDELGLDPSVQSAGTIQQMITCKA